MRTRQRTEKGHEVEIKILNKAAEIFRKSGYAEFRMADLSKETDMQLGAITYYYRKKTNILEKIFENYDCAIYNFLEQFDWFNNETSLFRHICSSIVFYTNILNDPACLRFFLEVSECENITSFYYRHIREKYDKFYEDYDIEISDEKFRACIILDFGSRNEFWIPFMRNEINLETSEALKLVLNLMPLLMGIDHREMDRIYAKSFERLAFVDYSGVKII